uniref:Uncharacterized protein n=1 Tax=Myripristis murdjan TaxID=586833 RepID=A0A667W958_9TELE
GLAPFRLGYDETQSNNTFFPNGLHCVSHCKPEHHTHTEARSAQWRILKHLSPPLVICYHQK